MGCGLLEQVKKLSRTPRLGSLHLGVVPERETGRAKSSAKARCLAPDRGEKSVAQEATWLVEPVWFSSDF